MALENLPATIFGSGPNSLGVIRSLSKRGVPCCLIAFDPNEISGYSRYTRRIFRTRAQPPNYSQLFQELLELLNKKVPPSVLFPTADWHCYFLGRHGDDLRQRHILPTSRTERLMKLIDKSSQIELAQKAGVPTPQTILYRTEEDLRTCGTFSFPVVIKPIDWFAFEEVGFKARPVHTFACLQRCLQSLTGLAGRLLIQECIPGPDHHLWNVSVVTDEAGNTVSLFTWKKLAMSPPHFGVATIAVSEWNQKVAELARRLAVEAGITSAFDIEFKLDTRDATYKLLEINPRIGMLNVLDRVCSVDTAWYAYQAFISAQRSRPIIGAQKEGIYYISLLGDYRGRPKEDRPFFKLVAQYLRVLCRPHCSPYWDWSDPLPYIAYLRTELKDILRNRNIRIHNLFLQH